MKAMYLGNKDITSKEGKQYRFLSFLIGTDVLEIIDNDKINLFSQINLNKIMPKNDVVLEGEVKLKTTKDNRKYLSYDINKITKA